MPYQKNGLLEAVEQLDCVCVCKRLKGFVDGCLSSVGLSGVEQELSKVGET